MKKIFIILGVSIVICTVAYGAWIMMRASSDSEPMSPAVVEERVIAESDTQDDVQKGIQSNMYRNEEWGFGFKYPDDWEIREPAFGSTVSLFNLVIKPSTVSKVPDPIIVNLTPKSWGEGVFEKLASRGIERRDVVLAGRQASYHLSEDMGIPMHSYFVLINDEYWINITGKTAYETELQQVLDSFYFIE